MPSTRWTDRFERYSRGGAPTGAQLGLGLILLVQLVFWLCVLRQIDLPGLYMDAVNPDYLAARVRHRELHNPVWTLPTKWFPILGNLYHGVQNYYVSLPVFAWLGPGVVAVRLGQALFGAVIVLLFQRLALRATGSALVATLGALLLATDIAFLASFRTQFYIIVSGVAWLLGSLLLLRAADGEAEASNRRLGLAGVCFGLAAYSYFVFLFFVPAMVALAARGRRERPLAGILVWGAGFALGCMTYVLGYVSMAIDLHGIGPALDWIRQAINGLSPLSSKLAYPDAVLNMLGNVRLALDDGGNETMIFGEALPVRGLAIKTGLLVLLALGGAVWGWRRRAQPYAAAWLVLLPLSYLVVASLLGNRLWVHHFSVLVPVMLLLITVAWGHRSAAGGLAGRGFVALAVLGIVFNLYHQSVFFKQLDRTGGVGRASSALTVLAEQALHEPAKPYYVFADWGFFMSFVVVTGNQVPFGLDAGPEPLKAAMAAHKDVRVVFWKAEDVERYTGLMRAAGPQRHIELKTFHQRDGRTAFHQLSSRAQPAP